MKTYEETIQRLARQAFDRYMQGSWDTTPDGTSLVAWVFDKDNAEVLRDIDFHSNVLIDAHIEKMRRAA